MQTHICMYMLLTLENLWMNGHSVGWIHSMWGRWKNGWLNSWKNEWSWLRIVCCSDAAVADAGRLGVFVHSLKVLTMFLEQQPTCLSFPACRRFNYMHTYVTLFLWFDELPLPQYKLFNAFRLPYFIYKASLIDSIYETSLYTAEFRYVMR